MFRRNRGFSLLELLIIILIIAILIAVAVPSFFDYKLRAQRTKAKEDIDIIINAINLFELEEGMSLWEYADKSNGVAGFAPTEETVINLLVGPYLKKVNADPWGNPYLVDCEVGYVISRGANGLQNELDTLADTDIKVFYYPEELKLIDAIYVDVSNDGLTNEDRVYLYFSQVIAVTGSLNDYAGDGVNIDRNLGADDDPAAAVAANYADITIFTTYDADGGNATAMANTDVLDVMDSTETAGGLQNDTKVMILELDDETVATGTFIAPQTESNLKTNGYIAITTAGNLVACDQENDGTGALQDRTDVVSDGLGVRVRKE